MSLCRMIRAGAADAARSGPTVLVRTPITSQPVAMQTGVRR